MLYDDDNPGSNQINFFIFFGNSVCVCAFNWRLFDLIIYLEKQKQEKLLIDWQVAIAIGVKIQTTNIDQQTITVSVFVFQGIPDDHRIKKKKKPQKNWIRDWAFIFFFFWLWHLNSEKIKEFLFQFSLILNTLWFWWWRVDDIRERVREINVNFIIWTKSKNYFVSFIQNENIMHRCCWI